MKGDVSVVPSGTPRKNQLCCLWEQSAAGGTDLAGLSIGFLLRELVYALV